MTAYVGSLNIYPPQHYIHYTCVFFLTFFPCHASTVSVTIRARGIIAISNLDASYVSGHTVHNCGTNYCEYWACLESRFLGSFRSKLFSVWVLNSDQKQFMFGGRAERVGHSLSWCSPNRLDKGVVLTSKYPIFRCSVIPYVRLVYSGIPLKTSNVTVYLIRYFHN